VLFAKYINTTSLPSNAFFKAGTYSISEIQGLHHVPQKSMYTTLPLWGVRISASSLSASLEDLRCSVLLKLSSYCIELFDNFNKLLFNAFISPTKYELFIGSVISLIVCSSRGTGLDFKNFKMFSV